MSSSPNTPRRIMLLTGASRGIGHATVKRFSAAGWRVITCSRHAFPENCPWEMGPEDHLQVDLADAEDTLRAIAEVKERLAVEGGCLHALVNNAGISPKGQGGSRLGRHRHPLRGLAARLPGQLLRLDHAGPRPAGRADQGQGLGRQRHLHRGLARPSLRGRRLRHLEGGARLADPRDGGRFRPARACASTPSRRARSTPRSCRPAPRRSSSSCRCAGSARPTRSPRRSISSAPTPSSYVTGAELHINGGQHV